MSQQPHTSNGTSGAHIETDLVALANNILEKTKVVAEYLQANNLAAPTFAPDSTSIPETLISSPLYSSLKTSLEDLQRLIDGPRRFWRSFCVQGYDLAAVQIALDFGFFGLVPAGGDISLADVALKAGLDEDRVSRSIRMMITLGIFQEPRPGFVSHNSISDALRKDEELKATVHYSLDEMLKAASGTADALKEWPYQADSVHSPFSKRHGLPIFSYYEKNPYHAGRFARAMAGATKMDRHINELRDSFPWDTLNGTVVDVGGGSGHISIALARLYPSLKFIVQDGSTDMLAEGRTLLSDDVRDQVSFMQHSFFEPQQLRDVGAFLIRQCTHNWCDRDVVTMLKSIVPGLEGSKPGTPLLINDIVLPEHTGTLPPHAERELRQIDMIMLVSFGAKQRTRTEFETLLKEADPRFELHKVHADGSRLGLLEVYLKQ
ncbi:hypothetical protein SLS53_007939 [Cytospora paraplurivora]|uniref:O-methyltransferase C-terminal domain-containing protein n=1 Tax=Cytospora paraplurivora TaxID=2898453 RepID=A0AAN9TZL1_9PEZI